MTAYMQPLLAQAYEQAEGRSHPDLLPVLFSDKIPPISVA
jgi:hypothetical protein